jgi:hypothetical protein
VGLIDSSLYYILVALSILSFAATIYFWPALSRHNILHVFGRILILFVTNLLIVVTLGISLNNYGAFYTSWSDLFGIETSTSAFTDGPSRFSESPRITPKDLIPGTVSAAGTVTIERIFRGKNSGEQGHVWIIFPRSAVEKINSGTSVDLASYRVLQVLPGFPGSPLGWIKRLNIVQNLETAWSDRKLPQSIAILTETNLVHGYDGECFDTPNGPQIETCLTTDIKSFAISWLGVKATGWGIMGNSTGGWCAPMLAIRHPDQYVAAASIAGYFTPQPSKSLPPAVAAALSKQYDLRAIIETTKPKVSIFVTVSPTDRGSYFQTIRFVSEMKRKIAITTLDVTGTGHNFQAWIPAIAPALEWFGTKLEKASI